MVDDVALNKAATIERCLARVHAEYGNNDRNLNENQTRQDSIILNLQRACEAAIDLAMHLVSVHRLGVPQETRHAFELLRAAGVIDGGLADRLRRMVGFRNIAGHDYQEFNLDIVKRIITERLDDFSEFVAVALKPTMRG